MAPPDQPKLRLKDRRRKLMWVKVAAGTSVVVVSLALLFYVARLPAVTIAEVNVTGTNLVKADEVKQLAQLQMKGAYGFFIPHANALVVPTGAIKTAIQTSFPPVASISISRKNLTSLDVVVTERQASALWCGDSASSSECYSMDAHGFIFAKADSQKLVRYYGVLGGEPIGSTYLGGSFASLLRTVTDIGASINHTPKEVVVNDNDVSLAFAEGGVLRFVRTADPQTTLQNVASVFASQNFKNHPEFEYVDFRFGDKVYIKFK